jgi:hypothetical protein
MVVKTNHEMLWNTIILSKKMKLHYLSLWRLYNSHHIYIYIYIYRAQEEIKRMEIFLSGGSKFIYIFEEIPWFIYIYEFEEYACHL